MKSLVVIMPSTRGVKAVPALLGVLNQRGLSLTKVIVTGASCNQEEFRERCARLSPRVLLGGSHPSDHVPPGKARNEGLDILDKSVLQPEYVMFCDDDIILPQDYASNLMAFIEEGRNVTAAMGRIASRPESFWTRVLDYSNFWWLQVTHDISDLGWLGAGATLMPYEFIRGIRFSESLLVNEDTDFFRRIANKSKGTLGICSQVTGLHLHDGMRFLDLVRKQYWNGRNSLLEFHSQKLSVSCLLLALRNLGSALKRTSMANRNYLMTRPFLLAGIFLSFACYETGIISGISRLQRENR